jgi:excisionase family DNA binding protein
MPPIASDWITLAEAGEMLAAANVQVSRSTLARWVRDGKLQSIRPGHRIYVRRAQVRSLLQPRRGGVPVASLQAGLFEDWTA